MNNIDTCRSYKTEARLMAALTEKGFDKHRPLVVCNRAGRFTAVFPASECNGALYLFAQHGFMTLG